MVHSPTLNHPVILGSYWIRAVFLGLMAFTSNASGQLLRRALQVDDEPPLEIPGSGNLIDMQFSQDPYAGKDRLDMASNGELTLVGLRFTPSSFSESLDGQYSEVYGEFCVVNPSINRQDPQKYSTFQEVTSSSQHCGEHRYTMPLHEVVIETEQRDKSPFGGATKHLPVSGLLFHEGYSGDGLISKSLATFDDVLVITDHPAISDALAACDRIRNSYKSNDCSPDAQRKLVQNVITLLSRTSSKSKAKKLYLELPSASGAYLTELRRLYPDTPWQFVFSSPEDALAKSTESKRNADCVDARRNPSAALVAKAAATGVDLDDLTHHEVCALHLATLLDAAAREHESTGTGLIVSENDDIKANPNAMVDRLLPYLGMEEEINADPQGARARVSGILSKGASAAKKNSPKNMNVSQEVGNRAKAILGDSMENVLRLR